MKKIILSIASVLMAATMMAQEADGTMNPLITAMPSLSIAPDARAAGLGDLGVATTADMNSQYWNAAKFAFHESHGGITANYTPWLRKLVTDIDLAHLEGFYKWDDLQGVGMSFTYFSMGDVALTDAYGQTIANCRPNEWALDASYYRKLHEYVSMGVVLRFLYSDLNNGISTSAEKMKAAWTMAADIDLYYKQPIDISLGTSYFSLGFCLQNLGGKMSYDEVTKNFIPANMRIGVGYELPFDNYNKLTFNLQADKLMVPSRKSRFTEGFDKDDSKTWTMSQDQYSQMSSVSGIFKSFADAPGGAAEEFKEVRWGAGLEYTYNRQFFARVGYSYENFYKGNRNYVTVGAGFHLSIVMLDVSYCIGLASSNPLDQTMRFTLGFDLAGIKDLVNNKK
ncbi:MAG: type IX secretion system outer membrane channel protein PorV [Paludibacteraceae bacterium]|nr:type IX secretion system outer membrane channel protein PorV [Paludibacteraceae bacterium]